jgi:hypothetical protein
MAFQPSRRSCNLSPLGSSEEAIWNPCLVELSRERRRVCRSVIYHDAIFKMMLRAEGKLQSDLFNHLDQICDVRAVIPNCYNNVADIFKSR